MNKEFACELSARERCCKATNKIKTRADFTKSLHVSYHILFNFIFQWASIQDFKEI